jgi:hypothetical protein
VDGAVGALAAQRAHHDAGAERVRVDLGRGARHPVGGAADGAVPGAARDRHLLRRVLPERAPAGVDVLLVLRGAPAPARSRPGVAVLARARVLGRSVRARCLQRRPLLRGAALGHPVHPAYPARGLGRFRAHGGAGLSLRDPAHRPAAHHSPGHQRVAQSPQELVGGADHQRRRADLPDPPDRDLHREGHRGPHRRHLVLCLSISAIMGWIERRTAIPGLITGGRRRA